MSKLNIGDGVWSLWTSAGLKQAFRPLLEQERISWWAWKVLTYHMFWAQNILLRAQRNFFPAPDKESHLAEVNLGPNLGDAVLHLRYCVHQEIMAAPRCNGVVYCLLLVCCEIVSTRTSGLRIVVVFFLTRTVVGCFAALEVPTLSKVVFVCQNRRNSWPKIVTAKK